MTARFVTVLLLGLLVSLHAQLWLGRGSVSEVAQMGKKLDAQLQKNAGAKLQNERLKAEVADLQNGVEMVEEKARKELGMVKPNEVFVQFIN